MLLLQILLYAATVWAACNGHDELCKRKYSDITFIGTHNSAFVGKLPVHNQYVSVTEQLDLGVRFLQAQTQDKDGDIQMCHTHCWELDEGPLEDYLKEISDWMGKNPDEVVTLLLTNIDALPIEKFDDAFNSTGLKEFVFRPEKKLALNEWPTLQRFLDDGTRLVIFMGMLLELVESPDHTDLTWITIWMRASLTTSSTNLTTSGKHPLAKLTLHSLLARLIGLRTAILQSSWAS